MAKRKKILIFIKFTVLLNTIIRARCQCLVNGATKGTPRIAQSNLPKQTVKNLHNKYYSIGMELNRITSLDEL
tara:strand:- start:360 stop:578 length:219 start_codon:yes stop_codon:yes gene_type:complete